MCTDYHWGSYCHLSKLDDPAILDKDNYARNLSSIFQHLIIMSLQEILFIHLRQDI
uniref:Uncharacterized protein n=1 Tax=Arion vulgaris TaxID=1028688 RepID=A0A0B7A259_9EUPU